jgi:hypothetical protein
MGEPAPLLPALTYARFLCTCARHIGCQVLAEELAPVAWAASDPLPYRFGD